MSKPGSRENYLIGLEAYLPGGRLHCPICHIDAVPLAYYGAQATTERRTNYNLIVLVCAACRAEIVLVRRWGAPNSSMIDRVESTREEWLLRVYPPEGRTPKLFPNTPPEHLKPYRAACRTLDASPEAAATMARRCLQGLLSAQGYKHTTLWKQIEALLNETDPKNVLPKALHATVDLVRTFGNFSAHPINDQTTLQIINVDPGEALWCVEIIEQLFDHYFEMPAKLNERVSLANAKFARGGRPPAKT